MVSPGPSGGWGGQVPEDLGVLVMTEQILVLVLKVSFSHKVYTAIKYIPAWG